MKLYKYLEKFSKMEKYANSAYEMIKANSSDKIAVAACKLAAEELSHEKLLDTLCREIGDYEIDDILCHTPEFNMNYLNLNEMELILKNEKDFFLFSLQLEKDSMFLYDKFKENFKVNSKEYKLFSKLAEVEKEHMYYILKIMHELG